MRGPDGALEGETFLFIIGEVLEGKHVCGSSQQELTFTAEIAHTAPVKLARRTTIRMASVSPECPTMTPVLPYCRVPKKNTWHFSGNSSCTVHACRSCQLKNGSECQALPAIKSERTRNLGSSDDTCVTIV